MTDATPSPTLLFRLYAALTRLATPLAARVIRRKLGRHGVDPTRHRECLGDATQPRPDGSLIWFHAASVGESLSALTLIEHLGHRLPAVEFLITSGTATSAQLIAKRLPPRTRHQFTVLDAPGPVARFLSHWRPDAAIFVESELWPLTLTRTRASGAKLALVNARLSGKSVNSWLKYPDTTRLVLDSFTVFLTQNAQAAENLRRMGAPADKVRPGTNLKAFSAPLPIDEAAVQSLQEGIGQRPIWIASSTHDGEEEIVLTAHEQLLRRFPDLCLILTPRHPERGPEIQKMVAERGLASARRSTGDRPASDTQVYLADTLGELGIWYAMSPIVFLGGSLKPIGGHNPFEVARAGAAVISGPGVHNFAETFAPLTASGGAVEVTDAASLEMAVSNWLSQPNQLDQARAACQALTNRQDAALDQILETLCQELELSNG
ncbi:MAG: 3-deoxy-D-manno-octulosonic acid transferase [Rhodobacteraceae bacterium]|nr:3-deoxy-D-manno-octulosonic acid transferase [Paracoccaceae bacterium]